MYDVILAGGAGTRFWPLSRRERPKQLIRLWGDETMIEATADRLSTRGTSDGVFVVVGDHLLDATRRALDDVPDDHFVVEPAPRNTAPAIALAAVHVAERAGDDMPMGIFPADHYIGDRDAFHRCLDAASAYARDGHIVTMGIEPTRPETGYGYIHAEPDSELDTSGRPTEAPTAREVAAFVEKPDRQLAREYLESGDYLWNSGMFAFTPATLFEEMERQLPDSYEAIERIRAAWNGDERDAVVAEQFERLEATSIDYGIMEGARDVVTLPASFQWSDVGHWAALDEVRETDESGNVVEADELLIDVEDSVVFSEGTDRLIAGVDLEDLVIVDTPDALLVVPRESAQKVRDVVAALDEEGRDDLL
jgi:mannose-1-phosphate guanylyltransferase